MFYNLKIAWRSLRRNLTFSVINIAGLVIGITSAVLIFLWVENNMSFNHSIPNSKNLYVIGQHQYYGDDTFTFFVAPGPLSRTLDSDFPEIRKNSRCSWSETERFVPEKSTDIFSEYGVYVDATMFDMLDMTFIRGNKATAFDDASLPIVLSEKMAEKIYGKEDPVGKRIQMKNQLYEITGVFKQLSENTSFRYEWMSAFRILEQIEIDAGNTASIDNWRQNWMQCYVEVEPTADIDAINQKLNNLIPERIEGDKTALFIYPIQKLRLYAQFKDGMETESSYARTVRLFFFIGVIILLIACINFMNLSTARSQKRALEVGVRKTFGTKRKGLINQFFIESGLIVFISLLIAIGLIYLFLPPFNQLVSGSLSLDWTNFRIVFGLLATGIICTVVAGSYPAFYLSSFSPVNTLKKQKTEGRGSAAWIRKGLVVFQFTIAFVLICATYVVYLQIQHTQHRDLGINKDDLALFVATPEIRQSFNAIENELMNTGLVESAGLSSQNLLRIGTNGGGYTWQGKNPDFDPLISHVAVSPGLIQAAGLDIATGRDFYPNENMEKGNETVIINQALAELMGEEGKVGGHLGRDLSDGGAEIVGVVKNFVFNDMYREKPDPVIMTPTPSYTNLLFVRLKPDASKLEASSKIISILKTFSPNESFEPAFMEDSFNNMFQFELLQGKLSGLFAGLAVFISCLGLFGLSAFSAEQRTKEIGIRKVLGASIWNILVLLGKSYMMLIMIALAVGTPIAVYITGNYLDDYAYRITIGWQIFTFVALLVVAIALLTMAFQSLKAAIANPANSIKTE